MTFSFRLLAIKRLFPSRRKSKEGDSNPSDAVGSKWSPLRNLGRVVPRKPRLAGGVKWHNMKGNYPSGKPRPVAGELQIADRHVLPKVSPPLCERGGGDLKGLCLVHPHPRPPPSKGEGIIGDLGIGSSLKWAASSFLLRDHPDPGDRISEGDYGR